jgi:uncharacterized membrane protein YbaN (DUF454 family)
MSLDGLFQAAALDPAAGIAFEVLESRAPLATTVSPAPLGEATNDGARPNPDAGGPWIGCDEQAGVIEIHDPRLLCRGHEAFCRALVEAAVDRFGAYHAEVSLQTSTCRLHFGPGRFDREEMARRAASAVKEATPAVRLGTGTRDGSGAVTGPLSARATHNLTPTAAREHSSIDLSPVDGVPESAAPGRRLVHLAMAGGSFAMAVGAVILPGIPTLPFLIMTGRHAVLISPRIERWLKQRPWCTALLNEAERSLGATLDWRSLSKMVGLAALFVAGIWIFHPPLPVVLLLEIGLMAVLAWRQCGHSNDVEVELGAVA